MIYVIYILIIVGLVQLILHVVTLKELERVQAKDNCIESKLSGVEEMLRIHNERTNSDHGEFEDQLLDLSGDTKGLEKMISKEIEESKERRDKIEESKVKVGF